MKRNMKKELFMRKDDPSPFKPASKSKVVDHPFFGMHRNEKKSVEDVMNQLRGDRYRAI